jgi:hypothetical protein
MTAPNTLVRAQNIQDANIQQSIELFLPEAAPTPTVSGRRTPQIVTPAPEPDPEPIIVEEAPVPRSLDDIRSDLKPLVNKPSIQIFMSEKLKKDSPNIDLQSLKKDDLLELARVVGVATETRPKRVIYPPKKAPAPPTLVLSVSTSATSTSNAFFSPTNTRQDELASLSVGVGYNPKLNDQTTLILKSSMGSVRFNEFDTLGRNTLSGGTAIQYAVKDSPLASRLAIGKFKPNETYTFEFGTTASFGVDFEGSAKMFYGLSAKWALDGIPLDTNTCNSPSGKVACVSAGLSAAIAQTYTNFDGGDNFAGILRADVTWRACETVAVKAGAGIRPKTYGGDDGHDDVLLSLGSSLEWVPNSVTSVSAAVEYETQDSTADVLEYGVFNVKPGLSVKVQLN